MSDIEMPWSLTTPQQKGRKAEPQMAKNYDARLHPGSGSGRIRFDASNTENLLEFKRVLRSHNLNGPYLNKLFVEATRQGKESLYIVEFTADNIIAEITLRRGTFDV